MKTAREREEAFRFGLLELLAKHNAELLITDGGMHKGVVIVTMPPQCDERGDVVAECAEFDLDGYIPLVGKP
ncbi:MAG TPA: hypothetical protein VFH17_00400 [Coriobacteriia bacterium]|nr:hypothetical protein [Coriobacteriia bacterium]